MYVYVDILFLLNFVMNSVVLMLTAQAAGILWQCRRIFLAAAVGSLYAVGAVVPELQILYSLPAKLCFSGCLILMAFGFKSPGVFTFIFSIFYLVSFIFGGAILGWLFFIDGGQWLLSGAVWSVSWMHLLGGSLIAAFLMTLVARSVLSKINRRGALYRVIIEYQGKVVEVVSLLDTGNRLLSPLSKRPVIVVEKESVIPIIGSEAGRFLNSVQPHFWLPDLSKCHDQLWLERIEPIPFRGIGGQSMLLGFRPDRIFVYIDGRREEAGESVVGIYGTRLSADGAYRALLHPLFIEGREVTRRRDCADQVANY